MAIMIVEREKKRRGSVNHSAIRASLIRQSETTKEK